MKYDAIDLLNEIRVYVKRNEYAVDTYDDLRKTFGGPYYKLDKDDSYEPENTAYSWVTNVLPSLVYANPHWKIRSRKGGEMASVRAGALEHAMNRWTQDYDLQTFLSEGPILDAQFGMGVALVTVEKQKNGLSYGDEPLAPGCHRISIRDFAEDPTAKDHANAIWKAHRIVCDRKELLARAKANPDEGWNVELIERTEGSPSEMSKLDETLRQDVERDEIVYWQVWVKTWKQAEEEDGKYGYHGTLVDVLEVSGDVDPESLGYDYVRAPRAYYGPSWGGYIHFGCFKVPDESSPLAPLVATKAQSEHVNGLTRSIEEGANSYSRFILLDEVVSPNAKPNEKNAGRKVAQVIQTAKHLHVYTAPAFDKNKVAQLEKGGVSQEQLVARDDARQVLNQTLGLSQTIRGDTGGGQTATADVIANEAATRRMGLMQLATDRSVALLGCTVGWFIHNDNRVRVFLGMAPAPDPETGEPMMGPDGQPVMGEAWFEGGADADDPFEAYEFDIEPFSMQKVSEAQRQAQGVFLTEFATQVVPAMVTAPWWDWKKHCEIVGNLSNIPDLAALLRVDVLSQAVQLQMQAQSVEGTSASPQAPKMTPKVGAPTAHPPSKPQQGQVGTAKKPTTPSGAAA